MSTELDVVVLGDQLIQHGWFDGVVDGIHILFMCLHQLSASQRPESQGHADHFAHQVKCWWDAVKV